VIKKNGSDKLYIKLFYHRPEPFVRSTYLDDNEDNRKTVDGTVARINADIQAGTFNFSKAFDGASEEDQKFFAKKEKRHFSSPPEATTFKAAYAIWEEERLQQIPRKNTREDYMKAINPHILPFFRDLTFDEIDEEKVKEFFRTRYLFGNPENGLVSQSRMFNIKIPLVDIWNFTNKRMKWEIPSPFGEATNETIIHLTSKVEIPLSRASLNDQGLLENMLEREEKKNKKAAREVILFSEYIKALSCLDPFHVPDIELMLLTGISSSEIAGLHVRSRKDGKLNLRWSISDMELKDHLKTDSRTRDIPLTNAISRVIDNAMKKKCPDAIFIFQSKTGLPHNNQSVRKAWYAACDKAGVRRVCPYSLRHSFVAYCELMGLTKPRIIGLMGHADKSMIDNIYGKYTHGTEKEIPAIKEYFGEDFWGK
jgi:integrase